MMKVHINVKSILFKFKPIIDPDKAILGNLSTRSEGTIDLPIKISFGTSRSENELLEKIFSESDLSYDIPSPRCKLIIKNMNEIGKRSGFREKKNNA